MLPFVLGFWYIYIEYTALLMTKVRRPCPHLCNTGQSQCKLFANLLDHNNLLHLELLNI